MHHLFLVMSFMSRWTEHHRPSRSLSSLYETKETPWVWILDHLARLLEAHAPAAPSASLAEDLLTDCDAVCGAIRAASRTMHAVLKQTTLDRAFAPQNAVAADVAQWAVATKKPTLEKAFESLSHFQNWARDQDQERAQLLLRETENIVTAIDTLAEVGEGTLMTQEFTAISILGKY